jgi:hypothetical protein
MNLQAITDDMDAHEIESLSMLSRGFQELRDVNPELSFNVILDILSGLNECAALSFSFALIPGGSLVVSFVSVMRPCDNMCRLPGDSSPTDV